MIQYIPKQIFNKGIVIYFISLSLVSIVFFNHTMDLQFVIIGIAFILLFFLRSQHLNTFIATLSPKAFTKKIFLTALTIRVVWVVFSYFFYTANTGRPFDWDAADAVGYHLEAEWLASEKWDYVFQYYSDREGVSDIGYPLYLTLIYKIFSANIIIARLFKALWSSITCVLIYKLSSRTFSEPTGRIASIFAVFMPNFILYCGLHLKETEMIFCTMMFLERTDFLLRSHIKSFINIIIPTILALMLFFFRTVLGVVAIFSFFTALLFNSSNTIQLSKKILISIWLVFALFTFAGGAIMTEAEGYWNDRTANQDTKRLAQTQQGAKWAKYATGTIMAPMIFVIPFSTMIDTNQQNQNMFHAGAFVKNFLGIFVLFALFYAVKLKKWRDFSLIGSFVIMYLAVIAFSAFANAERFHLPALPCILMMAAYGLSLTNSKNIKYFNYWGIIVIIMELSWAFFKLGSRGIL